MTFILGTIAIVGGAMALGSSITNGAINSSNARKDRDRAQKEKNRSMAKMKALERSRQEIINPYATVEDLSGNMSNTFAYLSVATGAAEIQMEQSDSALANTLDTLRATGAGAGGATALAQAALQSKKSVAANIEGQEVANQKLAAQGEQTLQKSILTEKERLQNAEIQGADYVFKTTEKREIDKMDRTQFEIDQARSDERMAEQARRDANSEAIEGVGELGMAGAKTAVGGM